VAIHTGDRQLARQASEIGRVMFDRGPPSVRRHAAWLFAMQAMADADPLGAHRWLLAPEQAGRQSVLPRFPMGIDDDVRLVRIAQAASDNGLAEQAVEAASLRSQLNPSLPTLEAVALHARGLLDQSQNDLAKAVGLYQAGPRPLALASAFEDLGVVTLERGETEDGVDALNQALSIYARAGATWDAGRVRQRLRPLGVRRRLVSAQRPERGWSAMTDSETAVARLVAEGLTNREVAERLFISPHTVGGHLRNIFTKLGVRSRVELARIAAGLEE
jgi:DNA-binding CsgD family transcriptional regulator